jgi:hypothetical protein
MDTTTTVASSTMGEVAVGGPVALTGLAVGAPSSPPHMATVTALMDDDENAIEEPEVVMGHPGLRAPGDASLSEEMGTTHFVLH